MTTKNKNTAIPEIIACVQNLPSGLITYGLGNTKVWAYAEDVLQAADDRQDMVFVLLSKTLDPVSLFELALFLRDERLTSGYTVNQARCFFHIVAVGNFDANDQDELDGLAAAINVGEIQDLTLTQVTGDTPYELRENLAEALAGL